MNGDYKLFETPNSFKRDDNELQYAMAVVTCSMCGHKVGNRLVPIDFEYEVKLDEVAPIIDTIVCSSCAEQMLFTAQLMGITTMPAKGNAGRQQTSEFPKGGDIARLTVAYDEDFDAALDNGVDTRFAGRVCNFVYANQE